MSSVINASYNNKILQDKYDKILGNKFRKLFAYILKRIDGLNLFLGLIPKMSTK